MPRRIEAREAIEVYAIDSGQVCIKQDSTYDSGLPDMVIKMDVNDVPLVIRWLQEAVEEAEAVRKEMEQAE